MACGCGKNRPPAGAVKAPAGAEASKDEKASASTGVTQSFALEHRSGRVETFGSRLEASAARVRSGGGVVVAC